MSMYLNAAETVFSVASVTSVTSDNNNNNNNNNNTPAAAEVSSMARQLPRHSHCSVSVLQAAGHS